MARLRKKRLPTSYDEIMIAHDGATWAVGENEDED